MDFLATAGEERTLVPGVIALAAWDVTPEHLRAGDPQGAFILYRETAPGYRGAPTFFRPVAARPAEGGAAG